MQDVLVSAYFGGDDSQRLPYFESLDELLRPRGLRLCLLEQSGRELSTRLAQIPLPKDLFTDEGTVGGLCGDLVAAAAVESATRFQGDRQYGLSAIVRYVEFVQRLFTRRRPCLCVLWNQFTGLHMAMVTVCRRLGIPWIFAHLGVLPGSIVFEEGGEMAESWVARNAEAFRTLPVDQQDLVHAAAYLEYARREKLNRKPQASPGATGKVVAEAKRQGRKIIFYAGQNDFQSGMYPPWRAGAQLHSPIYTHTIEALGHLAELAERHDWQILFKPHPNLRGKPWPFPNEQLRFPDRVSVIEEANVFECLEAADVTTTIVSQVSYLALIHNRPVVLLGRNQLSDKGCVYEPTIREDVANRIEQAGSTGMSDFQKEAWLLHLAQLMRYYLFDYDPDVSQWFANDTADAADYFVRHTGVAYGNIGSGTSEIVESRRRLAAFAGPRAATLLAWIQNTIASGVRLRSGRNITSMREVN